MFILFTTLYLADMISRGLSRDVETMNDTNKRTEQEVKQQSILTFDEIKDIEQKQKQANKKQMEDEEQDEESETMNTNTKRDVSAAISDNHLENKKRNSVRKSSDITTQQNSRFQPQQKQVKNESNTNELSLVQVLDVDINRRMRNLEMLVWENTKCNSSEDVIDFIISIDVLEAAERAQDIAQSNACKCWRGHLDCNREEDLFSSSEAKGENK